MLDKYIDQYTAFSPKERETYEFEIRFKNRNRIGRTEYDNVLLRLKSLGFQFKEEQYMLKISVPKNDIRTEIHGLSYVQEYCKKEIYDDRNVMFIKKEQGNPYDNKDYGFRISLQKEERVVSNNVPDWKDAMKTFRYMNRISATHDAYPGLIVDLSTVKETRKPSLSLKQSNLLQREERYEIEMEIIDVQSKTQVKSLIMEIIRGIQNSLYPISFKEMETIENEYIKLIGSDITKGISPSIFIGPSSISLEKHHLNKENSIHILDDYTVTDKADGTRKLLYISNSARLYFITMNMTIHFTGLTCDSTFKNTLIDGEHITNIDSPLYAAFDIYFIQSKDIRNEHFISENGRLQQLQRVVGSLDYKTEYQTTLTITSKAFLYGGDILNHCNTILSNIENNMYGYETDGLIFTPANTSVGGLDKHSFRHYTWNKSFKWKPPAFNTIDFLAIVQKENGLDKIYTTPDNISYKTLLLHVGYNPYKHGYIDPFQSVLDDNVHNNHNNNIISAYKPALFKPTNPSDENAMFCNVPLIDNNMHTEHNEEVIQDNTIIECKYIKENKDGFKWCPIRVRHDKTMEYRRMNNNFGNSYPTANSVWNSIHNPITDSMIRGIESIIHESDDDIYYNRSSIEHTRSMRDFHNLYVKYNLITSVSPIGGTLIDLAVGKAGDLSKWTDAKLDFVLGCDVKKDNIHNSQDGACVRYLKRRQKTHKMLKAVFIEANSSLNIKSGDACKDEKGKAVIESLFGYSSSKDKPKLLKEYNGIARNGFNVVSCQFAIHYFFSDNDSLHRFLTNVAECCALDGYFIGTTFDGETIFDLLKDKQKGDVITIYSKEDNHKVWEVQKLYEMETFDPKSHIYPISVYQDTINKTFTEYLVHYDYLKELLQEYGFEESPHLKFGKQSTGMFSELFYTMQREKRQDKRFENAIKMNDEQKQISFLNRYFIFKKVRDSNKINNVNDPLQSKEEQTKQLSKRMTKKDIKDIFQMKGDAIRRLQYSLESIAYGNKSFQAMRFMQFAEGALQNNNDITDYQIYMSYKDSLDAQIVPDNNTNDKTSFNRGYNRAKQLKTDLKKHNIQAPVRYLDYGCGDGSITRAIQTIFNISKENVFCTDIKQYPSTQDLQFITFDQLYNNSNSLHNSMDMITAFMVFHHLTDSLQLDALRTIYKILKPGGTLVIREHNSPTQSLQKYAFQKVVDIYHDIYDYVLSAEMNWDTNDYYSKYKSSTEWDKIISSIGFKKYPNQRINTNDIKRKPIASYMRFYYKPMTDIKKKRVYTKKINNNNNNNAATRRK